MNLQDSCSARWEIGYLLSVSCVKFHWWQQWISSKTKTVIESLPMFNVSVGVHNRKFQYCIHIIICIALLLLLAPSCCLPFGVIGALLLVVCCNVCPHLLLSWYDLTSKSCINLGYYALEVIVQVFIHDTSSTIIFEIECLCVPFCVIVLFWYVWCCMLSFSLMKLYWNDLSRLCPGI